MEESSTNTTIEKLLADQSPPENIARGYLMRGAECEQREDWNGAVKDYSCVLSSQSSDPVVLYFAHNNLGYSLLQLGRYAEAEMHCEAAIVINGEQHNAYKNLALALQRQGSYLKAAFHFARASLICPADMRASQHLEQLLASYPQLLADSDELRQEVGKIRAIYQAQGLTTPH